MKNRFRNGIAAVGLGALLVASASPARASTSDSCRNPEWIYHCTCLVVAGIGATVVPDSQWHCPRP